MPFPLAHPAAVLPLRRFCPAHLSFVALMIGSLAPDASYLLRRVPGIGDEIGGFAHSFIGSLAFCLPAGLLMLFVFRAIREPLAQALPSPHCDVLVPLTRGPHPSLVITVASLLLGIWTHLLLDLVTRESRFMVGTLPLLQPEMEALRQQGLHSYHVLWYALTGIGLLWLAITYLRFLKRSTGSARCYDPRDARRYVAWAILLIAPGLVVLPYALRYAKGWPHLFAVRQFLYGWSACYLASAAVTLVALGFFLRFAGRNRCAPSSGRPSESR